MLVTQSKKSGIKQILWLTVSPNAPSFHSLIVERDFPTNLPMLWKKSVFPKIIRSIRVLAKN